MPEPLTRPLLPLWVAVLAAVAGGLVYDLGFPGASVWPLAFVGIALALVSLIGRSAWSALLVGFAFGLAFYLQQVSWTSLYLGPVPWLALSVLESLFVAVGGLLIALAYRWVPRASSSRWVRLIWLPLLVAGLWCAREAATGSIPYGGFPWGRAALSQSQSPFADVVSWVGSTGLGFIMVAIVAGVIEWVRLRGWQDVRAAIPVAALVLVAILVPAWPTTPAGELRVASVQGNGPTGYFDERAPGDVLEAQLEATEPILDDADIDVLLWPEGGSDIDPTRSEAAAEVFDSLSEQLDAPVVLNTVTTRDEYFFNTSTALASRRGRRRHVRQAQSGAVRRVHPRSPVLEHAGTRPHRTDPARVHARHERARVRRGWHGRRPRDLFRRDLRRVDLGGGARRRRALHVPDEQRRLPRHRREPAAARDRAPARDRDRAFGGEHLDGRHESGHRPDGPHDRRASGR